MKKSFYSTSILLGILCMVFLTPGIAFAKDLQGVFGADALTATVSNDCTFQSPLTPEIVGVHLASFPQFTVAHFSYQPMKLSREVIPLSTFLKTDSLALGMNQRYWSASS